MKDPAYECPPQVVDFALQAVEYVQRALDLELDFDDSTLPFLDHYLRQVPTAPARRPALALVAATAGAYFGEVVRRRLGGIWQLGGEPAGWRLVLPSGLSFSPAALVAAAIARADVADEEGELDARLDAPPHLLSLLEATLGRMADVSEEDYYSLCGRFDTLEHVEDVLRVLAAERD